MTNVSPLAYAKTPTGNRIRGYCRMAHQTGRAAVVIGPPGVGKTEAVLQFASEHVGKPEYIGMPPSQLARYVQMTSMCFTSTHRTLLRIITGIEGGVPTRYQPADRIGWVLSGLRGPLILDEAQWLNAQAIETLRALSGDYGVPLVFVGNHTFGTRFDKEREGALAAFASRVVSPLRIDGIQREDVDAIGQANGVTNVEALDVLAFVASRRSDLRPVEAVIRAAAIMGDVNALKTLRQAAFIATGEELPKRLPRSAKILPFKPGRSSAPRASTRLSTG